MTQKGAVILESKQGEFVFQYFMPIGASYNAALTAASDIFIGLQAHIKEMEEKAAVDKAAAEMEPLTPEVL